MTNPLKELADEIEAGPSSRELSAKMMVACGWKGPISCHPTCSLDGVAALSAKFSVSASFTNGLAKCHVWTPLEPRDGNAVAKGEHARCRAECAALLRAMA